MSKAILTTDQDIEDDVQPEQRAQAIRLAKFTRSPEDAADPWIDYQVSIIQRHYGEPNQLNINN